MKRNKAWLRTIRWTDYCMKCRNENGGKCNDIECAKVIYGDNGDVVDPSTIQYDGDYKLLDEVQRK